MELVRKVLNFKTKNIDLEAGIFEGHASTFGNVDSQRDVLEKGSFINSIKESGHRVKVFFEHFELIGQPIEMREDDIGLFVKAKISLTTLGKDVLILMRDGALSEMSIGFQIIRDRFDKATNVNHIIEAKLWEFSLVPWGANDQALVTGVKSRRGMLSVNELKNMLSSEEMKEYIRNLALDIKLPINKDNDPDLLQSLLIEMRNLKSVL